VVAGAVTVSAKSVDVAGANVGTCSAFLRASSGTGDFPYIDAVTIVNTTTNANVNHSGHGMATNDKVVINGANHWENNGVFTITVIDTTYYSYTMPADPGTSPTGTITSTFVALNGVTDSEGDLSTSRVYSNPQPVTGWVRNAGGSPYYKTAPMNGTISTTLGFAGVGVMVEDE
jgi:hypothetical protein